MSRFLSWLIVTAVVYILLLVVFSRLVYYPMRFPGGWWEMREQVGAADVWLQTSDGVRLHSWWTRVPGSNIATLYLHGNGGNITHRADAARQITGAGTSLLQLEYRGYGRSEGIPTEKGLYRDAEAGYDFLVKQGYSPKRIIIHGESLGTAVAIHLATSRPCAGVVLEAPFTSAGDIAATVLPVVGRYLMWGFDTEAKIAKLKAPLLVLHGDHDEVISYHFGRRLFDAAPNPKSFFTVKGAGHNNILQTAGPDYQERLQTFYKQLP